MVEVLVKKGVYKQGKRIPASSSIAFVVQGVI
jgi:hypothetical protein